MKTIQYTFGNEHNPTNPFGRAELNISNDGGQVTVTVWHYLLNQVNGWAAELEPETEQKIWQALAQVNFPNVVRPLTIVPDTTLYQISTQNDEGTPAEASVMLPLETFKEASYGEVLGILDSIIYQVASINGTQNTLATTVVSNVRHNYTETVY